MTVSGEQSSRLEDLIPEGVFVGTSLILQRGGRFLFGMRPVKEEAGRSIIELTGIGGGIESKDLSYAAGVLREAQEEIGCDVDLIPCAETLVVHGRDKLEWVALQGGERPAALVFRHHRTPAHDPWHECNEGAGYLIVYPGHLRGTPRPGTELPWLLWLWPQQVLQTAQRDVRLDDLRAGGARLVVGSMGLPPNEAWLRLTDSQEALGIALGDGLPAFYRSLEAGR